MNALLDQFLMEARENLAFIEQNLESLGSADKELLNAVFRAAHTLKGGSGIVGFESVKNITHKAEDLLDALRSGKLTFQETMIDALFDAFDEVVDLIEAAEQTGDVVGIDEDRLEMIIHRLNLEMGITPNMEKEEWKIPFALADELFFNNDLTLSSVDFNDKLPFEKQAVTEEFVQADNAYAILYDVSADCMIFGNDPMYATSLLECGARGFNVIMEEEAAKAILSGFDDEEGKTLRIILVGFVRGSYERIEESLYNFMDELLFYPLSISDLLSFEKGQFENVAFIKDFCNNALEAIKNKNRSALDSAIKESLGLIALGSAEYAMVKRLDDILSFVKDDDLPRLSAYIHALAKGEFYKHTVCEESTDSSESSATQAQRDPKEIEAAKAVLRQQLMQLKAMPIPAVIGRVKTMCTQVASWLNVTFDTSLEDAELIIGWINNALGESNTPISVVAPVVEEKPVVQVTPPSQPTTQSVVIAEEQKPKIVEEVKKVSAPTKTDEPKKQAPVPAKDADNKKSDVVGKVIKVEQEIVDHLMSLSGELLIEKNSLPYLADAVKEMDSEEARRAILEKYFSIGRLSNRLQDLIMSMRMLPISYVFDRYPKLVRDISKNLGKKVKLEQEGGDTKLDKNMIEMLADPLIHIMRNSLDHGVEMPDERKAKGKDETGSVKMRAYPQSDKVILEIIDDGKGIDAERVAAKVLEKGLMSLEKIEELTDQEKVELIMLPGLSTAETISEYSGRGVGMDVVKKSIESFGGSVTIQSKFGEGTKLTLAIPVSLAVTNLLHVFMNNFNYGFPMDSVSETVKLEREQISTIYGRPVINIRGQVIPLLYVPNMLDETHLNDKALPIVILNVKGNQLAVVVNELLGQLDVVQKPLEGVLSEHPMLSGTSLLGNGQIIMIIDPIKLYSLKDQLGSNGVI